jgi:hypothetical protein
MKRLERLEGIGSSASMIPAGRMGTVKEINDATIYLFADTGSYVNGATIVGKYSTPEAKASEHGANSMSKILIQSLQSMVGRGGLKGRTMVPPFLIRNFCCRGTSMRNRGTPNYEGWERMKRVHRIVFTWNFGCE